MDALSVLSYWDRVIDRYLEGDFPLDGLLGPWFRSYKGTGQGAVDPNVMPEPYLGNLRSKEHRMVFLGLNPGSPRPTAQSRTGTYADEIRRLGGYSAWAATWPYLRDEDVAVWGRNVFHAARLRFMRDWYAEEKLSKQHMLNWELYPWHSKKIQGARMRPPSEAVREYVWEPLRTLRANWVFAFGKPWFEKLEEQGLRCLLHLGHGGEGYPTRTKPGAHRTVKVYEGPGDSFVVAMSTAAAAAPPNSIETSILREELGRRGFPVPA